MPATQGRGLGHRKGSGLRAGGAGSGVGLGSGCGGASGLGHGIGARAYLQQLPVSSVAGVQRHSFRLSWHHGLRCAPEAASNRSGS